MSSMSYSQLEKYKLGHQEAEKLQIEEATHTVVYCKPFQLEVWMPQIPDCCQERASVYLGVAIIKVIIQ